MHAESPSQTAGVPVPEGQIDRALGAVDGLAEAALARTGIPGLAVAVVRGDATVYAKGFGVRKRGEPAQVDADTVFQLASVSKSIGATVVARQVGARVIAWDTPIRQHLPWFALADDWVTRNLTIGDLYAHRSGLPEHAGDDLEDLGYGRREVLERLRHLPLHPFRSHYAYTNFGLTAAAEAVAAASGRDWESLSEEVLYRPLGMSSTSSRFTDFERRPNRAHGHVRTASGFEPRYQRQPDAQSPAGGVSASVLDVARWMALVLRGGAPIVAPEALLAAATPKIITRQPSDLDARADTYGYGFGVGVMPSGRVALSHSGAFLLGAGTTYLMLPSLGIGIAALSNAAPTGAVEAVARSFADLVQFGRVTRDWLSGFAALMAPSFAPVGHWAGESRPASPAPSLPAAAYAGQYRNVYFGEAKVDVEGGRLVLTLGPGRERQVLEPWSGNSFTYRPTGENAPEGSISEVSFLVTDGRANAMTVEFLNGNGLGTFRR